MLDRYSKDKKNELVKKTILILVGVILCAAIGLMPPFEGLQQDAMLCLAILFGVVYFITTKILTEFLAAALGFVALVLLQVTDIQTAFSGLANPTVVLLFGSFGMGGILAQTKTFERISRPVLAKFATSFKGRTNALTLIGMLVTPLIPSNSAKGVIMSSLSTSVGKQMGYKQGSQSATGLFMAGWIPVGVLGVCFLSGNIFGALLGGLVEPEYTFQFTWVQWFVNAVLFGVIMFIGCFIATKILYRPGPDDIDEEALGEALEEESKEMSRGSMSRQQKLALAVIVVCLILWIFSASLGLNDAWIALVGFILMVLLGCADKRKVLNTTIPWDILIFVAFGLSISTVMTDTGLSQWMTGILGTFLIPLMSNIWLFIPAACIAIYLIRMVVVSQTLVITTLFLFLMPVGIAVGIHPWIIGFICITTVSTWNVLPQSITFLAAFGAAKGYIEFGRCVKMSFFVMIWTIISLLASVYFWMYLGLL